MSNLQNLEISPEMRKQVIDNLRARKFEQLRPDAADRILTDPAELDDFIFRLWLENSDFLHELATAWEIACEAAAVWFGTLVTEQVHGDKASQDKALAEFMKKFVVLLSYDQIEFMMSELENARLNQQINGTTHD